jgi:hypothetical protein
VTEPRRWSVWYHPKTDSHYVVLGVGTCSTNGEREGVERSVFYFSLSKREFCYREVGEFMDGRFVEVDPPHIPASGAHP